MKTLNLRSTKYHHIDDKVLNFIIENDKPVKIVIGDSVKRKRTAIILIDKIGFDWHYKDWSEDDSLSIVVTDTKETSLIENN